MPHTFRTFLESEIKTAQEGPDGLELAYHGEEAKGSIYAKRDEENPNLYRVTRVLVKPEGMGYGKRLYMAAMEAVSKKGGMLAPAKNSTSDPAANVWKSLYTSSQAEKTQLKPGDWSGSGRMRQIMARYPNIRYSDPNTYPPRTDADFWAFNSGYTARPTQQPQIHRRNFPPGTENLELEEM